MQIFFGYFFRIEFFLELIAVESLFVIGLKRKKYFLLKLLVSLALCFSFALFVEFGGVFRSFKFIILFFATLLCIFVCWDIKFSQCAFIAISSYSMQHIAFNVGAIFNSRLLFGWIENSVIRLLAHELFIYGLIYTLMYFIFIKRFRKEQENFRIYPLQLICASAALLVTVILNLILFVYGDGASQVLLNSYKIYGIVCCLFSIAIQGNYFSRNAMQTEAEKMNQLLAAEYKNQQRVKDMTEFIHIKCHDLRKQVNSLKKLKDENAKAESIEEIEEAINYFESDVKTGNDNLDVVLTEKNIAFKKEEIQFSYFIDGESIGFMNALDVYSLFSNILDNALECVRQIGNKEKRIVSIKAYKTMNLFYIEQENCFEENINFENGYPVTTKDKAWHGFGVKSIVYIAEKYGGKAVFGKDENLFKLKIIIPIP